MCGHVEVCNSTCGCTLLIHIGQSTVVSSLPETICDHLLSFDSYILEFDDDEEDGSLPQRAVPFYRVVALPEGHRQ